MLSSIKVFYERIFSKVNFFIKTIINVLFFVPRVQEGINPIPLPQYNVFEILYFNTIILNFKKPPSWFKIKIENI